MEGGQSAEWGRRLGRILENWKSGERHEDWFSKDAVQQALIDET